MFIVRRADGYSGFVTVNDVKDVGDFVIGITGSEEEGARATNICGLMHWRDRFFSEGYVIECLNELED